MANLFPEHLETDRLICRMPEPSDASALAAAIDETFDQLHLWMPWAKSRDTLEDPAEVITQMRSGWAENQDFPLFCFERESGQFVMAGGLHPVDIEVPSFHIGYWCRTSLQGNGYVSEVVRAIRDAGFETVGARRIEIRCDEQNIASRAVAERCGFLLEAVRVNDCRDVHGFLRSTAFYVLTRDE